MGWFKEELQELKGGDGMDVNEKRLLENRWDAEHEKRLDRILSENKELQELFEKYPERKDLYKLKILNSEMVEYPTPPDNIFCKTCIFQLPPTTIDGKTTSRHDWGKCRIMDNKPFEVLYEGARCEFYEQEKRKK